MNRRQFLQASAGSLLGMAIVLPRSPEVCAAPKGKPRPRLGMNLSGIADWNTELPFVDVFRMSRPWISQRKGASWGKGPPLALDEHGWVKKLEPGCWAETLVCTIPGGHFPGGRYTVLYEGKGRLEFAGSASVVSQQPGRVIIEVDPNKGPMFLRLKSTAPDNYVRKIRVIMPGFEKSYATNPFHPVFLRRWKGVACLRFMDWMKTNGSRIKSWSDRPELEDATFSAKGVPVEAMVDLCNRLKADAWFCMPHMADDDYVRKFASVVHDKLEPALKVYVEYSNEVWNSRFQQTHYAQEKAKELGIGPKARPWEGGGMYYARRSVEIFKIWKDVFGNNDRVVRVLSWQSGNTWWMEHIVLVYQDAYKHADALAIAPYFHMIVPAKPSKWNKLSADVVSKWSVDQVLDFVEHHALPDSIQAMEKTKKVADRFGLTMVAYEGGQHLVGVSGGENNEQLTRLFQAANAHPRMGEIYSDYLDGWVRAGGDLFCHFSSVGKWSKWGSWGLLQFYDQDPRTSPKFLSVMKWAKKLGQPVMEL